jgi:hypothetical protein
LNFTEERGFETGLGAGLAAAVLGGALSVALGVMLVFLGGDPSSFELLFSLQVAVIAFLIAAFVIGLAAIAVGLPLTWMFAQYGLENPWIYPLVGFVSGAALVVFVPLLIGGGSIFELLPLAWVGGLPGAICGAIWWLTYRRRASR